MTNKTNDELKYLFYLWFNTENSPLLDGWPLSERDENYYVNEFYENIVFKLTLPKEGKIIVLGTHNCISFDKICKHYGYDRTIGYDLFNPNNHPNVINKDCEKLSENDDVDIALGHNDMGSFWKTPELKLKCQKWAARNIVKGGYLLGNNNYNRPRINIEKLMKEMGFNNIQLLDFIEDNNIRISLNKKIIKGYMLSIKL